MTVKKAESYYSWFRKVIAIFIELFFSFALVSTLYVFTYPFDEKLKIIVFVCLTILFCLVVFLLKNKVRTIVSKILSSLQTTNYKKMLLTIIITMISLKVIYTLLFYFDPTKGGDIMEYAQIAKKIVNDGYFKPTTISHLLGIGFHLAFFDIIGIPYHFGIFIVFLIGTIINFYSFSKIIGKEKSFVLIMLYLLMPSTILLTFCPTHELFVYLYLSLFMFIFNTMLQKEKISKAIKYLPLLVLITVLCCFVNPVGYILIIIMALSVILSNVTLYKKILIVVAIALSLFANKCIDYGLKLDDTQTSLNTLYILIRGSSVECKGEHVDGYTEVLSDKYLEEHNLEFTWENKKLAMEDALVNQYKYLLTHPIDTIKLLAHKFYIEWSGNHYSIELAHNFGSISDITFYIMLSISSLIYMFVLTIGIVFYKKKDDQIYISNYKLALLGVVAMLLISLVLNKYSVYMMIFIFLISFYRLDDSL